MPVTVAKGEVRSDIASPVGYDDTRVLGQLGTAITEFRALGERVEKAIRFLDKVLDTRSALPLGDLTGEMQYTARYLAYRAGPTSSGHPSVRDLVAEGWKYATPCRLLYRQLSASGQVVAQMTHGTFTDAQGSDSPLWLLGFPQAALDELDKRAAGMGIVPTHLSGRFKRSMGLDGDR